MVVVLLLLSTPNCWLPSCN